MRSRETLKGSLLIAAPGLIDPNFLRTVVFIAEHNEEGALGLILNRPSEVTVGKLWTSLSEDEYPKCQLAEGEELEPGIPRERFAHVGGPVQENAVLLLHGHADLNPGLDPVIPGVFLASDVALLQTLLERACLRPAEGAAFRVFCGYAGWGSGQLDQELQAGGWIAAEATSDLIFRAPTDHLWNEVMDSLGGVYRFFAQFPTHPEHN